MEPSNKELSLLVAALMYHLARIEVEVYGTDLEEIDPLAHARIKKVIGEARTDHNETFLTNLIPSAIRQVPEELIAALSWSLDQVDDKELNEEELHNFRRSQSVLNTFT